MISAFRLKWTNTKKRNPLVPLLVLNTTFCLDMQNLTGTLISLMYYIAGEKTVRHRHDGDAMMESVDRESSGIQI